MKPEDLNRLNRKIISVSSKRQITIPLNFYKQLRLENEVECAVQDGALIIRPIRLSNGEFSVEILRDLVAQGYSGNELVHRFESESKNIRKAIGAMLEEAAQIASGEKSAATLEDIFGAED
jgi:bifunctional DNA-binding transcriptional regulator/antitoxin component of YhaV-PrlF toxin-antitoxin module